MLDDLLLPLLPSLVALVEEGSVTRAARRLGLSQPRMSGRLAELRKLLNDPLLVPTSQRRGLTPTDRALSLSRSVKAGLIGLEAALTGGDFDPNTADHTFKILAHESCATLVGGPLLQAIRVRGAKGVRLAFFAFERAKLSDLESGRFDLVLGRAHHFERTPRLRWQIILRDDFATIIRPGGGEEALDLDAFCTHGHLLISSYPEVRLGKVDEALAELGRKRTVIATVESHLLAVDLVAKTDLIATLPRTLAEERRGQVAVYTPPLTFAPFVVCAAWHERQDSDPAHRWLRSLLPSVEPIPNV